MLTEYMNYVITAMVSKSCNVIRLRAVNNSLEEKPTSFSYVVVIHEKTSTVPITLHNKSYVVSKDNKKKPQKLISYADRIQTAMS